MRNPDKLVPLAYLVFIPLWSLIFHKVFAAWTGVHMFGWEYGNIAESLAKGEGFSGSMCAGSGPTAWMAPFLSWLYAGIFLIFGIRTTAAVVAAYLLKVSGMAATLALQLRLLRNSPFARFRWILILVHLAYLGLDYLRVLNETEDVWLQNLALTVALSALMELNQNPSPSTPKVGPFLLTTALLLPLISPVSAAAFYVCALAIALGARAQGVPKGFLVAVCLSLLSTGGWTLRNKLVLGEAYPIKSNVWFDFVEANLWDDDGILTDSIFTHYHPVNLNERREEYVRLGEREFLRVYRAEVPKITLAEWSRRCLHRVANAAYFLLPEIDMCFARDLTPPDLNRLEQAGLIGYSQGYPIWLFCAWDDARVEPVLAPIPLQHRVTVLQSRHWAHQEYLRLYCGWDRWLWGYAHALVITLAVLFILATPRLRSQPLVSLAVVLYLAYLIPYILVSHYERYQVCAGTLQAFILTLALCPRE